MDEERDLVEEELQAILAASPWNTRDCPTDRAKHDVAGGGAPPPAHADIRARYNGRIVRTVWDQHTGELTLELLSGRTLRFDSNGSLVDVGYRGIRGVLMRARHAVVRWLSDTVIPWRRC